MMTPGSTLNIAFIVSIILTTKFMPLTMQKNQLLPSIPNAMSPAIFSIHPIPSLHPLHPLHPSPPSSYPFHPPIPSHPNTEALINSSTTLKPAPRQRCARAPPRASPHVKIHRTVGSSDSCRASKELGTRPNTVAPWRWMEAWPAMGCEDVWRDLRVDKTQIVMRHVEMPKTSGMMGGAG